jgi:hypothetical protein
LYSQIRRRIQIEAVSHTGPAGRASEFLKPRAEVG